ncbi:hypothetical protein E2C01_046966 [Portunus trituberculatus]|uniref:Uncharacterized protein n=1 Tax=Portunus trituberculatus TaxID=210409 RepID=A0A5B7G2C5_PORTR|nr:hypothetical protein [Portunus trituberculatus]
MCGPPPTTTTATTTTTTTATITTATPPPARPPLLLPSIISITLTTTITRSHHLTYTNNPAIQPLLSCLQHPEPYYIFHYHHHNKHLLLDLHQETYQPSINPRLANTTILNHPHITQQTSSTEPTPGKHTCRPPITTTTTTTTTSGTPNPSYIHVSASPPHLPVVPPRHHKWRRPITQALCRLNIIAVNLLSPLLSACLFIHPLSYGHTGTLRPHCQGSAAGDPSGTRM